MYISHILSSYETEEYISEDIEETVEHRVLGERLRKTLYYGRPPGTDRPSMPLTELAVEYFRDAAPKQLGRVDMDFASDVGRKAYASPCSLMVGMMYVRRLKQHGNPDYLQQINSSDLFLISMLVASKYLYDEGTDEEVFNDEWADAAGMEPEEINELEREFLRETGWNLYMNDKEFADVLRKVEMTIAFRKGRERGSFTYTDLHALTDDLNLLKALNAILVEMTKVVLVCCMAYAACTMTMALSPTALSLASSCVRPTPTTTEQSAAPSTLPDVSEHSTTLHAAANFPSSKVNKSAVTPLYTSITSVMKDLIGLWVLPESSTSMNKDNDWLCEFGPCGQLQQSAALRCINVTSQTQSCRSSPCCCCQPMPHIDDYTVTGYPHATITSLGWQAQAVQ